jgi:hypothetical protein
MKDIIESISHFQGELVYNLNHHREKFLHLEHDLGKAVKTLNLSTYLRCCGAAKTKGYPLVHLFYAMLLLPFLNKTFTALWRHFFFLEHLRARKDTYYRALKYQGIHWRALISRLCLKAIASVEPVPLREKLLIADDTINPKRGKRIELTSYVRDHTHGRTVLGMSHLVLSYFDGKSLFPLDFSIHTSSKRPKESFSKAMDGRTVASKRRKEAFRKKTDLLIEMVQRAWNHGVDACFVLFDSWFASPKLIRAVYGICYEVICQLKRNNFRYLYQGRSYTLKRLYREVAQEEMHYLPALDLYTCALIVEIPDFHTVTLVFSKSKKATRWVVFLSTDTSLTGQQIIETYAKRWAIELFFKDCKQLLHFGREQNQDFDAILAHHSLVFIRYILLAYILRAKGIYSVVGTLFEKLTDQILERTYARRVMDYFKLLLCLSIEILSLKIPREKVSQLLQLIDYLVESKLQIPPKIVCES